VPQDFQDLYHTVHADPSARAKVPILQDDGFTLIESALTVEYLDAKYPSAGARLYPEDPALRFKVQLFAETFTEQLSYIGLLRADSVEAFEAAKQKFITGLTVREFGDQLSV
jgi:glutathione S-transferase